MPLRIRHIDPDATPGSHISLEALARVLRPEILSEVIDECQAHERRTRKLPAVAVVVVCVAMNLYAGDCLVHVFFRLVSGLRWLLSDPGEWRVSKGALCQARYRLGAPPLVALFKKVCANKPLADPETEPDAFLFGLRLMALDSTVLDLPDTPENVRAFGKRRSPRGESAWPQARVVAISECSTHAICEAGVWPHDFDERAAGRRLLRGVGRGVLLLWDRGFHCFDMVEAALSRGAELLGRLPQTVKPEVFATLSDGTELVWLKPSEYGRRKRGERVAVRLIRYTLDDPKRPGYSAEHRLITSLVDPRQAPAEELIVAYHARWEFEVAVDEIKSHQLRTPQEPVRSKKPVGVVQEVYGLLVAHYVVRAVMVEAAREAGLAPSRMSFTATLGMVREMVPEVQRTAAADRPRLYRQLLADIGARPLAPRANRTNPRVVKRKMSNFGVKGPHHRHWPQPTKPFREAVVLLN
jgi:hypothetical protein